MCVCVLGEEVVYKAERQFLTPKGFLNEFTL